MPTPASVKLLYDESQHDATNELATWSPSGSRAERSRSGSCLAVLVAILMFVLGLSVGAFVHALAFPEGGSPLALLGASNSSLLNIEDGLLVDEIDVLDRENSEEEEATSDDESDRQVEEYCKGYPWQHDRLPSDVRPQSYNLTIHPNITTNVLLGSVTIDVEVMKATKLVVVHAERLHLTSFWISANGQKREAEHFECDFLSQWAFVVDDELEIGDEVELGIEYEGEVLADLQGLYITRHTDSRGVKSESLITQFEPSFARRVFPCWDEPAYKATFQLSVVRESRHFTRSNMNLRISKEHVDGLYMDIFHRSVKMSTYLLAVAVLDSYDYVKRTTRNTRQPIEVRLYAPRDVLSGQSEFGLDTSISALEYFEQYFNISYPLEKIDLVALDDFSEGAMENWGLVTFRDSALLYAEGTTSSLTKEHIALVVCHEIAHQWFGNLVTMSWWNDLWLNEGFANYMEYKCVEHLFPDWNIMTRFYAENVASSQEPDGLHSSRAISSSHAGNDSILSLFDAISYHKAAAIIHMMQSLAGEENFQRALIEYLQKYAYGNAKGSQLWEIVEKHAEMPDGVSMASLAKAYTEQEGYPVVRIRLDSKENEVVILNQTRFLFDEGEPSESSSWPIPIHYRTDGQKDSRLQWLRPDEQSASWSVPDSTEWILANTGGVGYFKVLYEKENYRRLAKQLVDDHTVFSSVDRAMLLTDAYDFSKTSLMEIGLYMDMLQYAKDEDDRMAWSLLMKQLRSIDTLVEETAYAATFKDFQRSLILGAYEKFAWKNGTSKGLQLELVQLACRLRMKACTKQALASYNQWIQNKKRPDAELVGVVLEEGVRQGGVLAWERALATFQEAKNPSERQHLIAAMAATTDATLINRMLRMCLDGPYKPNVVPRVLSALSQNEVARTQTWRFFRLNFTDFAKLFGEGSSLLTSALRAMAERLSTEQDISDLQVFLKENKVDANQSKVEQLMDNMSLNVQWRHLNEVPLGVWLSDWDDRRRTLYRARKHTHARHTRL